jgi:glutamate--cysteine ligase catalytic subunit
LQLDHRSASTTTEYEEMTIDEIFNGSKSNFPGLLTFVEKYVELQSPDEETRVKLFKYIDFIRGKAQGLLLCKSPSRV